MSAVEVLTDFVAVDEFRSELFPTLSPAGVAGRELKQVVSQVKNEPFYNKQK
jgi:hypothetical protein